MSEVSVFAGGSKHLDKMGTAAWSNRVRGRAKELAKQLEMGYMELAKILYQVYDTQVRLGEDYGPIVPIYTTWGYKTFSEYAEKELGLHHRKAERLRSIWYKLEIELSGLSDITRERIVRIGWTKVRELIRVLTVKNADDWVEQGEKLSYPELYEAIRLYQEQKAQKNAVSPEDEDIPVPAVDHLSFEHFALYEAQAGTVRTALKEAEKVSGSDKKSHNLDLICSEFLATNDFHQATPAQRQQHLANLERSLGLRLVAVDPETGGVIYGIKTLQFLAKGGEE